MYIKTIKLKGFRTYRDLSTFKFSPGYNVIVGLNGSGKSNVLLAISFILAETVDHACRTQYLYQGGESSLDVDYTGSVEVTFDISSERNLPATVEGRKELCLKRIFSETKDVYMVNGRQVPLGEYRQLLESVNLIHFAKSTASYRSDLHFIIKQGAVCKISNVSSDERLKVLREVIGHRSFDIKIDESSKLLRDSGMMYKSIENQLNQISKKLQYLDLEKRELDNWKNLDSRRKELQINLILLRIKGYNHLLEKCDRNEEKRRKTLAKLRRTIEPLETELEALRLSLGVMDGLDRSLRDSELSKLQLKLEELLNEINELSGDIELLKIRTAKYEEEIEGLNGDIKSTSDEVELINTEISRISDEIVAKETRVNDLLYDQRDPKVKKKAIIDNLVKQINLTKQMIREEESKRGKLEQSLMKCEADIKFIRNELIKCGNDNEKKLELYKEHVKSLERITEAKRLKQKELADNVFKLSNLKISLIDAGNNFRKISNQNTLELINSWFDTEQGGSNKQNYVGLLIDLINVKDEYRLAIEQVLGNKLFTIVVSNMSYAKTLVNFIEGREGFYNTRIASLDMLKPTTSQDDDAETILDDESNSYPLVNCVSCDERLKCLISNMLNEYDLVPDLDTAVKMRTGRNYVTPNGEIFYSKGVISGGYVNIQDSVLQSYSKLKNIKNEIEDIQEKINTLNEQLNNFPQEQSLLKLNRDASRTKWNESTGKMNSYHLSLQHLLNMEESIRARLAQDHVAELRYRLRNIEEQIKKFNGTEAVEGTTNVDEELAKLNEDLSELKNKRAELQTNKGHKDERLNNLVTKRNDLSKDVITNNQMIDEYQTRLQELRSEVDTVESEKNNINEELKNTLNRNTSVDSECDSTMSRIASLECEIAELMSKLEEEYTKLGELTGKRNSLNSSINECNQDLNSMDGDLIAIVRENMNEDRKGVLEQLSEINKACMRLDFTTNKVISKNYASFKSDYEQLNEKRKQIDQSKTAILKTIKALNNQKDTNLIQLVQRVNENISEIFEELVPSGRIKVILIKRDVTTKKITSCLPECFVNFNEEDQFVGLEIKVSFNNQELQHTYQLSGGQKTIVSLSFMLAIQRLRSAPFYLFDEIDAALDDQYRTRVARLLQKQSQKSQCIVTTFKDQLVMPGEVFYEIKNVNGISHMKTVDLQGALRSISQEPLALAS